MKARARVHARHRLSARAAVVIGACGLSVLFLAAPHAHATEDATAPGRAVQLSGQADETALGVRIDKTTFAIETILQRTEALARANGADDKGGFGLRHDELRARHALRASASHLGLGDPGRALEIVQGQESMPAPVQSDVQRSRLKVEYESARQLEDFTAAARVCLRAQSQAPLDETWNASCAFTFARGVARSIPRARRVPRETFDAFAFAASLRRPGKKAMLRSILIASGLARQSRAREAIAFLKEDIARAHGDDSHRARGWFTLALLQYQTGSIDDALTAMRFLAGDSVSLPGVKALAGIRPDVYTAFLAQLTLARVYAGRGQHPAAQRWYESVLQSDPAAFKNFPREKVEWELAQVLFRQQKYAEASRQFETLANVELSDRAEVRSDVDSEDHEGKRPDAPRATLGRFRTTAFEAARILCKSESTRDECVRRLSGMLGTVLADLAFLREHVPRATRAPYAPSEGLGPLLALSDQYGLNSPEARRLREFNDLVETHNRHLIALHEKLSHVLLPADFASLGVLDAARLHALKALVAHRESLLTHFFELDAVSRGLWDDTSGGVAEGEKHRRELKRRFTAFEDLVSRTRDNANIGRDVDLMENTAASVASAWHELRVSRASFAATRVLAELEKKAQFDGVFNGIALTKRVEGDEHAILGQLRAAEESANEALVEQRLLALQSTVPESPFEKDGTRIARGLLTLRGLADLHRRQRRVSAGPTDDVFFNKVDDAWKKAFAAHESLSVAAEGFMRAARAARRDTAGDVQALLRERDLQEKGIERLKEATARNMREWATVLARQLDAKVRAQRNAVVRALAETDIEAMSDASVRLRAESRAKEERARWIESLRTSVEWGLAR